MRKAFFVLYALVVILGVGAMIGFWYETKGRGMELGHSRHFYTQSQLYEEALLSLSKVCLKKYGAQKCLQMHFAFEGYSAKLELKEVQKDFIQVDICVELLNPLNGGLLRRSYRGFLDAKNL